MSGPIVSTHQCGDCGFVGDFAALETHQCPRDPRSRVVNGLRNALAEALRSLVERLASRPDVRDALTEALRGQDLWHGRHATSPAGDATVDAILAHPAMVAALRATDVPSDAEKRAWRAGAEFALHESNHHGWGGPCETCEPCPHHGNDCTKKVVR